jgi:hypothetical protein
MNKDKLQVGDLVRYWTNGLNLRAGLVIDDDCERPTDGPFVRKFLKIYRVYWFKTGETLHHSRNSLIKLKIPNE